MLEQQPNGPTHIAPFQPGDHQNRQCETQQYHMGTLLSPDLEAWGTHLLPRAWRKVLT